ncbi:MAG TPA: hypothetical protein VG842_05020 [Sediminibacterium sp.]|nr:hypothetical protein [Sediminibacterium sp.]
MICSFIIVKYPKGLGWAGLLSMFIFRFSLWFRSDLRFWKLMGCGKSRSFDFHPDFRRWAVLLVPASDKAPGAGSLLTGWWKLFRASIWQVQLTPVNSHGKWDGDTLFEASRSGQNQAEGPVIVLTRATIRLKQAAAFWRAVPAVAEKLLQAKGLIFSIGIGEVPWLKQATLSIWENQADMKAFAYSQQEHARVIQRTRQEKWYREEMFIRFRLTDPENDLSGLENILR